jgi:hypothetical protein
MTAAVLDRPISFTGRPVVGDGVTLEELLSATLHAARANGSTECPVCHARMTYTRASAPPTGAPRAGTPASAECGGCGSRLS